MSKSTIPLITICNEQNQEITTPWKVDTLDINAGSQMPESNIKELRIWNNKDGEEDVPNLVNATITTKNINGENTNEQLVVDRWVKASCKSSSMDKDGDGVLDMVRIGGTEELFICSDGASNIEKENHIISGKANNGSAADISNYATVKLKVCPKINAIKGLHQFKVRVSGFYT